MVLLEGASDVAAVRHTPGMRLDGVALVDLHGVTNVRTALLRARADLPDADVLGMCDQAETRFVERALVAAGLPVRDASDLASYGFFVCHRDLEEELISAVGTAGAVAVIADLGLDAKLETLQRQPAWADRPLAAQLRRFCGVASGRKELLAGALAAALPADGLPGPLRHLRDRLA